MTERAPANAGAHSAAGTVGQQGPLPAIRRRDVG